MIDIADAKSSAIVERLLIEEVNSVAAVLIVAVEALHPVPEPLPNLVGSSVNVVCTAVMLVCRFLMVGMV